MKLLTQTEISHVSGAVIKLSNGLGIQVSSVGIPTNAYNFIDKLQNQLFNDQITTAEAARKIFIAGYANHFTTYKNHFENGHFTIVTV